MKNALLILFAATAGALLAVCVVQWQKHGAQRAELTSLRNEVEQKSREAADAQDQQDLAERQKREFLAQASDLAGQLQKQRLATAKAETQAKAALTAAHGPPADKDKGGFGAAFAKMMDDPAISKMIRDQQATLVESLYSPLVRKINLTPEEANQFKDLITDNMMKGASQAMSLFGAGSGTNRAENMKMLNAEQQRFEEEIRSFLGDARFAEYKEYQQTAGERMLLNQFQVQNEGGQSALTETQTEQLLSLMKEEKQAVAAASGVPMPESGHDGASLQTLVSEGGTEKILQAQETINQRVYESAREVLSAAQLEAFRKFQGNQLHTMRLGMSMAREVMKTETVEAPSLSGP